MLLVDFKKTIYAFIGRNPGTDTTDGELVQNSVDQVLVAINMARLKAQRDHDFMSQLTVCGAQISKYGKAFDSFVTVPEGSTALSVKSVHSVYAYSLDGGNVALGAKYDYQDLSEMGRVSGRSLATDVSGSISRQFAYTMGRKLFLWDVATPTWVACIVLPFLADLTNDDLDDDTDFFIAYGNDWLLMQSLEYLQMLIKEDTRVQISEEKKTIAWESLKKLDSDNGNWTDLD